MGFKDRFLSLSQGRRVFLHLLMEGVVSGLVASCYKSMYCSVLYSSTKRG